MQTEQKGTELKQKEDDNYAIDEMCRLRLAAKDKTDRSVLSDLGRIEDMGPDEDELVSEQNTKKIEEGLSNLAWHSSSADVALGSQKLLVRAYTAWMDEDWSLEVGAPERVRLARSDLASLRRWAEHHGIVGLTKRSNLPGVHRVWTGTREAPRLLGCITWPVLSPDGTLPDLGSDDADKFDLAHARQLASSLFEHLHILREASASTAALDIATLEQRMVLAVDDQGLILMGNAGYVQGDGSDHQQVGKVAPDECVFGTRRGELWFKKTVQKQRLKAAQTA